MVFITDEHDLLKINNSGKYGYAYQKKLYPHSKEPFCSFWDFLQKVFSIYEIYCLQV